MPTRKYNHIERFVDQVASPQAEDVFDAQERALRDALEHNSILRLMSRKADLYMAITEHEAVPKGAYGYHRAFIHFMGRQGSKHEGICFAQNGTMSRQFGISERTIRRWRKHALDAGIQVQVDNSGRGLALTYSESFLAEVADQASGRVKAMKEAVVNDDHDLPEAPVNDDHEGQIDDNQNADQDWPLLASQEKVATLTGQSGQSDRSNWPLRPVNLATIPYLLREKEEVGTSAHLPALAREEETSSFTQSNPTSSSIHGDPDHHQSAARSAPPPVMHNAQIIDMSTDVIREHADKMVKSGRVNPSAYFAGMFRFLVDIGEACPDLAGLERVLEEMVSRYPAVAANQATNGLAEFVESIRRGASYDMPSKVLIGYLRKARTTRTPTRDERRAMVERAEAAQRRAWGRIAS